MLSPKSTPQLATAMFRDPAGLRLMLRGELDIGGVTVVEEAVMAAAAIAEGRLVIDLSELRFMDLFGARELLHTADRAISERCQITIANPNRNVRRVFDLMTDLSGGGLVGELVETS